MFAFRFEWNLDCLNLNGAFFFSVLINSLFSTDEYARIMLLYLILRVERRLIYHKKLELYFKKKIN